MTTKSDLLTSNSTIQEEILIKSLIDEIYNAEENISRIKNSKENSQNGLNISNHKLFELKALQNNLEKKLVLLNNNYQSEISSNKNQILAKKNMLNELDISMKEYQNKLSSFNVINFKSPLLTKYVLENDINNKILSQEQINDICLKNKNINENEIRQLMREIEINKASESVIVNNKNEINKKLYQINENLSLLKEEKLSINDELIDIISYKESLECINKNNILKLIKNMNSKTSINDLNKITNNIQSQENKGNEPIKLYLYELKIIDHSKASNKICDEISDAFRIIGSYNSKNNISYITNDMINNNSKNNTNINFYPSCKNKDNHTIDIFENKKNVYTKDALNNTTKYKNKSLNNSCIDDFKENNYIFERNTLKNLIKKEINSFVINIKNNYQFNNDSEMTELINNFLNDIAMIISNQLKNSDNNIFINYSNLHNDLICYLSYFFKIFYYDIIIENNYRFINKEYKTQKKEYKRIKEIINNELLKLENKYDEIKAKKLYNENQLNILNSSNKNKIKNNDNYLNLSPIEQSYIQTCIKINSILKQKEDIKNTINQYENDINHKKNEKDNEIENINNEIEKLKKEINDINNEKELNTLKNNDDIIKYRKIIADKFNTIKEQLQLYKTKYGSNLSLYNKFINNINNSIQKTYNKSFFDIDKNKTDFINYDLNNGIIMNGGENKTKNDKYINLNMIENIKNINSINNNIKNSKIFNTNRLHENNSFNKSINYKNNKDIEIDKNINKLLNKTMNNLHQSSDYNLSSNELCLVNKKNTNFINNIKIEKINRSFYQYSSLSSKNSKNKKENKANSTKKGRIDNNFDLFNKNIFNLNKFIKNKDNILEENIKDRDKKLNKKNLETNSKTFSHPFFKKQSKSQGGTTEPPPFINNTKTTKNSILNINLFRHKKNYSNSGIHKAIPKGSKIINNENIKNEQNIKNSIKNIKTRIEKNSLDNYSFLYKLNPLTKITFCYYREMPSNNSFIKYNPLRQIPSSELCEYPYNFIKSTISLNKNYKSIKIVPSSQLEPIDIKISMVENTVVSSAVKSIIDIHRNYYKWKENNKGDSIVNEFINEQIKKYENLNQEDVEKCIINKNFNFSIIINSEKNKNNKRIEFIICSYDEFKMWINGMAFIIKNKNNIVKLINEQNK